MAGKATPKAKTKLPSVSKWKPKDEQILCSNDGKLFIIHFDKIYQQQQAKSYNNFIIRKGSYENQLPIISQYVNYFMNFYDDDMEIAGAYYKLKYMIDKKVLKCRTSKLVLTTGENGEEVESFREVSKYIVNDSDLPIEEGHVSIDGNIHLVELINETHFTKENMEDLIDYIYDFMFTDSVIAKITTLVEDNYLDDIESNEGKYVKEGKQHLESLEFKNKHIKILLKISFGMKLMSPIMLHYCNLNSIKIEKDSDIIFDFYKRLFMIFADDCDIYNKLYIYIKRKVTESNSVNQPIFDQRQIFGVDISSVVNSFVKKVLISENMVKYKFNEVYDSKQHRYKENIIGFNKTIIKYQLNYFLKEQYQKNLTEVTNTKNSEGLTGVDKMEMNLTKIDEGAIILADINIYDTIAKLKQELDVPISEDEIQYYFTHHKPKDIQIQLVNSYYAKYFGSIRDLALIPRHEYMILLLLLKKKLLLEAGYNIYDMDECDGYETSALPYILTGNVEDKINTRVIRNSKFISKLEESSLFQDLIHHRYRLIHEIKPDYIVSLMSSIINTRFSYVVFEQPELLGKEIQYSEDKISDEILFFLKSI